MAAYLIEQLPEVVDELKKIIVEISPPGEFSFKLNTSSPKWPAVDVNYVGPKHWIMWRIFNPKDIVKFKNDLSEG
jgi:hypothetical protein